MSTFFFSIYTEDHGFLVGSYGDLWMDSFHVGSIGRSIFRLWDPFSIRVIHFSFDSNPWGIHFSFYGSIFHLIRL